MNTEPSRRSWEYRAKNVLDALKKNTKDDFHENILGKVRFQKIGAAMTPDLRLCWGA